MLIKYRKIDYNQAFEDLLASLKKTDDLLYKWLSNFDSTKAQEVYEEAGRAYKEARASYLDLLKGMDNDFIPPMDLEDILDLARALLDLQASIKAVIGQAYMYRTRGLPRSAQALVKEAHKAIQVLASFFKEFQGFGRNDHLKEMLAKSHQALEDWEALSCEMVRKTFSYKEELDIRQAFAWTGLAQAYDQARLKASDLLALVEKFLIKYS